MRSSEAAKGKDYSLRKKTVAKSFNTLCSKENNNYQAELEHLIVASDSLVAIKACKGEKCFSGYIGASNGERHSDDCLFI